MGTIRHGVLGILAAAAVLVAAGPVVARHVTIRDVALAARVVVLDVQGPQAEVAREAVRKRYVDRKDVRMLDAAGLTDDEVQKRLGRSPFVVYGTIGGRAESLTERALAATPLVVRGQTVSVDGVVRPTATLQLIAVAANPFGGSQAGLVFAVGDNTLLPGLLETLYGPTSSLVVLPGGVIVRGYYDSAFRPVTMPLSKEAALDDAAYMVRCLEDIHPEPCYKVGEREWRRLCIALREEIEAAGKVGTTVPRRALAVALARAVAGLGDGSTFVVLNASLFEAPVHTVALPPFVVQCRNERFVVAAGADGLARQAGTVIETVQREAFDAFVAPVLAILAGDTTGQRMARLADTQTLMWHFVPLWTAQTMDVGFAGGRTARAATVDLNGFRSLLMQVARTAAPRPGMASYDDGTVVVARFDSLNDDGATKRRMAEVAGAVERGATTVVLDLRTCEGGRLAVATDLLKLTTKASFRLTSGGVVRLSTFLPVANRPVDRRELLRNENFETTATQGTGADRVVVMTGPLTAGPAAALAAAVQDGGLGLVVGEPTGSTREACGEAVRVRLPHSSIELAVATTMWKPPKPKAGDRTRPVAPDRPVDDDCRRRFGTAADPTLACALEAARAR